MGKIRTTAFYDVSEEEWQAFKDLAEAVGVPLGGLFVRAVMKAYRDELTLVKEANTALKKLESLKEAV